MSVTDELLKNNEQYAASFDKGELPIPPAKSLAVVACMDARLHVSKILGLQEGDAHIIRNAGGVVTDDAIRSLVISQRLLGTTEIILIHHTDCGMLTFTNEALRQQLARETGADAAAIDFLPFTELAESVREDVRRIQASPFIADTMAVSGFIYDVRTGQLQRVV